jgi:hypothetical protein
MSVKRNVTVPEGGVIGIIGVEGRATMTVQFTKRDRHEVDSPAVGALDSRDFGGSTAHV